MGSKEENCQSANTCGFSHVKGYTKLLNDEGKFIGQAIEYNGHLYSYFGEEFVDRMNNYRESFPVSDDDIYLLTYPKSGTHWLWEILMMLSRGSSTIREEHKHELMLEFGVSHQTTMEHRPRIINTHLVYDDIPVDMLHNKRAKFIQIHRNPADVAVSFFHHLQKEVDQAVFCNWEDYIKLFCDDKRMIHSTWFDYTCKWWPSNKQSNFLSVFYEDLKQKPHDVISEIADFLDVSVSSELLASIVSNTTFQSMKTAKRSKETAELDNIFVEGYSMYRKGVIGDWRSQFTREQHEIFLSYFNKRLKDFPELKEKFLPYMTDYE